MKFEVLSVKSIAVAIEINTNSRVTNTKREIAMEVRQSIERL